MFALLSKRLVAKLCNSRTQIVRTFLSSAYSCNEIWDQRKRSKIFQKIDYDDLYHQLDRSFQIGYRISVLDIDLFANGIDNESFQLELEDVLFKLRLNPESGLLSERTMHAVVRYYIAINKRKNLLDILSNRLNYGIFPDYYASNILMDQFIKENDHVSAAKIAVLQMLQEDFNHPILKILSIYACVKYLNGTEVWELPKEPEVDPDEEEERVRVSFIRNPYFDDHFDIVDPNQLIGKTLHLAGATIPGPIGLSSQVLGLVLHKKHEKCISLLKHIVSTKAEIYEDALRKALEYCSAPKQAEGADPGPLEDASLKNILEEALSKGNVIPRKFEDFVSDAVTKTVKETEAEDIQAISKLYRDWENEREQHIAQEIYESNKKKAAQEIANTKEDLKKREEMIFFFDKEDEWNLKVEQKLEEQRILSEEESKLKKKDKEEEYIPPEVKQKRS